MGYTHSWRRPAALPAEPLCAAAGDLRLLLPAIGGALAGPSGRGAPVVADDRIAFNGAGPNGCESFEFLAVRSPRRGESAVWSFCKTQRLPYDSAVRGALIVLAHHLGSDLCVASDADDEQWAEAHRVVEAILGPRAPIRLGGRSDG